MIFAVFGFFLFSYALARHALNGVIEDTLVIEGYCAIDKMIAIK